jgi:rod shape-determining protein MreD
LHNGIEAGLIGFFFGLLRDIFFGKLLGVYALIYMLIGYFSGKPFRYFYRENYFVPVILCFCMTIIFELIVFIINFNIFSKDSYFIYSLTKIIFVEATYNALLIFILYRFFYFLDMIIEKQKNMYYKT